MVRQFLLRRNGTILRSCLMRYERLALKTTQMDEVCRMRCRLAWVLEMVNTVIVQLRPVARPLGNQLSIPVVELAELPTSHSFSVCRVWGNFCSFTSLSQISLTNLINTHLHNMASRGLPRALRAATKQKLPSQAFQRRTLSTALSARPTAATATKASFAGAFQQQTRGVKTVDFAGHKEQVFGMCD